MFLCRYVEENHNMDTENRVRMIQNAKMIIKILLDHGTDFTQKIKHTNANVFDFIFRLGSKYKKYNEINCVFHINPTWLDFRSTIRIDNQQYIAVNEYTCIIPKHSWPISEDGCVLLKPANNLEFPQEMHMNVGDYEGFVC